MTKIDLDPLAYLAESEELNEASGAVAKVNFSDLVKRILQSFSMKKQYGEFKRMDWNPDVTTIDTGGREYVSMYWTDTEDRHWETILKVKLVMSTSNVQVVFEHYDTNETSEY